jgi:hypothetical protein
VLTLPSSFLNEPNDAFGEVKMMASKAYSIKQFWYVDYEVVIPDAKRLQYQGRVWQVPIILVAGMSASIPPNEAKRKQLEAQVSDLRAAERVAEAITLLQEREKNVQKQEKELKSADKPLYIQVIDTFPPISDSIWDEIDLLEGDPPHRGAALRNQKFKPFWLAAEEAEWAGLWDKGVFKRWEKSDLLKNDRVFTSRYVYKPKRNAKTGAAYRFKARLIVRGFEMVKGLDYEDNFSPTPGISIARLMVSIAAANDLELHSVDIEQAFTQADKLKEGADDRYFKTPPSDSPMLTTSLLFMRC